MPFSLQVGDPERTIVPFSGGEQTNLTKGLNKLSFFTKNLHF